MQPYKRAQPASASHAHCRKPGLHTVIYCQQNSLGEKTAPVEGEESTLRTVVIGVLCGSWVSASRTALATIGARVFRDIGRVWEAGRRQGACLGVGGLLSLAHLQQTSKGDHLGLTEPGAGASLGGGRVGLGEGGLHRGGQDRWGEQQLPRAHCLLKGLGQVQGDTLPRR